MLAGHHAYLGAPFFMHGRNADARPSEADAGLMPIPIPTPMPMPTPMPTPMPMPMPMPMPTPIPTPDAGSSDAGAGSCVVNAWCPVVRWVARDGRCRLLCRDCRAPPILQGRVELRRMGGARHSRNKNRVATPRATHQTSAPSFRPKPPPQASTPSFRLKPPPQASAPSFPLRPPVRRRAPAPYATGRPVRGARRWPSTHPDRA